MRVLYRSLQPGPERDVVPPFTRCLRHPVFAWLRLRPLFAEHTRVESEALRRWARNRKALMEIGVAEGASALALRQVMHPDGTLYLVDPFHLSRLPVLNAMKRAAHSAVNGSANGRVVWIQRFSVDAARGWSTPIEFLFLDGDHAEGAVRQDWHDWHPYIPVAGVVAFH